MIEHNLSLEDVKLITEQALIGAGTNEENAKSVARSTVLAERDGIRSHGLMVCADLRRTCAVWQS